MKTGREILKERGLKANENGLLAVGDLLEAGLPPAVKCTGCEMTMGLLSAFVDDEGYVWCSDCALVKERSE